MADSGRECPSPEKVSFWPVGLFEIALRCLRDFRLDFLRGLGRIALRQRCTAPTAAKPQPI